MCCLTSFVIFVLGVPPPTLSTLFPYTTLFRSAGVSVRPVDQTIELTFGKSRIGNPIEVTHGQEKRRRCRVCLADRKSTRLNSSHVRISYAVFCLKKKNYFRDLVRMVLAAEGRQ